MALPTPTLRGENLSHAYVSDLNIAWSSATTITLAAGQARNSSNLNDIVLSAGVTINAATVGANGLDTGALANSTLYAVWVIGDSTSNNASAGLLSTSGTDPILPLGYDMARRVGWVLTSGAAAILDFSQRGNDRNREMYYAAAINTDIAAGNAVAMSAVDSTASVPVTAKEVFFLATLTADAGGERNLAMRSGDSTSAAGQAIMTASASDAASAILRVPCGTAVAGDTDYLVSNAAAAANIDVIGYLDTL